MNNKIIKVKSSICVFYTNKRIPNPDYFQLYSSSGILNELPMTEKEIENYLQTAETDRYVAKPRKVCYNSYKRSNIV